MQVLLKEDVESLGYAGDVKKVADGYGRNYLLPRGLAVLATSSAMNQAEAWRMKAEARRAEMRAEYEILSERISAVVLEFTAKTGESGKLYGSITTADITDGLNAELGTEIDRRKVTSDPLRMTGEHKVAVRLNADFQPELTVIVLSENEPEEEESVVETVVEAVTDVVENVVEAITE
jgi:large subunit ribosomal protein L9